MRVGNHCAGWGDVDYQLLGAGRSFMSCFKGLSYDSWHYIAATADYDIAVATWSGRLCSNTIAVRLLRSSAGATSKRLGRLTWRELCQHKRLCE